MAATLETALYLASMGFYIAPLKPNSKLPSGPWTMQSTINPITITGWFKDEFMGWDPEINIMIDTGKSGLCVIDIDNKGEKEGTVHWRELMSDPVPTFTVETPSGGYHLYYTASGFANTAGKLAADIDTRAEGGYVVAPSSTIDGVAYTITDDSRVVELPLFIAEKLSAHRIKTRETGTIYSENDEGDLDWAISFLQNHEPAIEGAGGDNHTFITFCKLKEHGIGQDKALELVLEHWNDNCSPPWDYDDLEKKCDSAYRSAQNATGVKSAMAEFRVPTIEPAVDNTRLGLPLMPFEQDTIPFRDWVFGEMAIRGKISQITAPGGSSKSTFTMVMALSKASGRNLLDIDPKGTGRVWIYNNEDDMEELKRRLIGLMGYFRIGWHEICDEDGTCRIMLSSGERIPFQIARRDGRLNKIKPFHADQMVKELIEFGADLLIVDPFAETHPAQENSNDEIKEIGQMYRMVAQRAAVSLLLVHHTRKHDNASSDGQSGNMDSARGASALSGLVRIMFTLYPMSEKQAKKYGIKETERWRYVLLEQAKANLTKGGVAKWYIRDTFAINVSAENPAGEEIGVLRPVNLTLGEDAKPEVRTLIKDIESLTEDGVMRVGEIARQLVTCFPFHANKDSRTVEKAIKRLFGEDLVCTGIDGMLYLEEALYNGRLAHSVRFNKFVNVTPQRIDEML